MGPVLQAHKSPQWSGRADWGRLEGERALRGMRYFNEVLRHQPYVAGDAFSMADITVFAGLLFTDVAGLAIPADCQALQQWRARVAELPSVKNRTGQGPIAIDLQRLGLAA